MEKSFEEFREEALQKKGKKFKVRGSWGIFDAYKAVRKHKWYNIGRPLSESEFFGIVRKVNDLLAVEIANGNTVRFPERMGELVLKKFQVGAFFSDGKLKVTYPVDWNATWNLWYTNEAARRDKTLLRNENPWVYHVKYCKQDALYENKSFYQFVLNTFIKRNLSKNIKAGKVDTAFLR